MDFIPDQVTGTVAVVPHSTTATAFELRLIEERDRTRPLTVAFSSKVTSLRPISVPVKNGTRVEARLATHDPVHAACRPTRLVQDAGVRGHVQRPADDEDEPRIRIALRIENEVASQVAGPFKQ
jgi:hypothetical protein